MPREIKRVPLTDQASEAILDLIDSGLQAGDSLPGSGELAETLGVSVPVVREAIAGLAAIGVIKRRQGKESVVAVPGSSDMSRLLSLRIRGSNVGEEKLQEFREVLEVGNARLAARHRTDEDLVALETAMDNLRKSGGVPRLHDADVAFHAVVGSSAHNDLCKLTLDALEPLLKSLRLRVWQGWVQVGGDLESIVEAHAKILDAIRAGDETGAAEAMLAHLDQARRGLVAAAPENTSS